MALDQERHDGERVAADRVPLFHSLFFKVFLVFSMTCVMAIVLNSLLFVLIFDTLIREYVALDMHSTVRSVVGGELALVELFVVGASVLVAYLTARRVSVPINGIVDAIHQAARGDLSVAVPARRHDEFGRLAVFFNDMMRRVRAARERNERTSQVKSRFLTVAAHQLRTPLTAADWSLKLLLDGGMGELADKQRTAIQHDYELVQRMTRLVNQLLSVARLEQDHEAVELQEVAVGRLLSDVLEEFQGPARAQSIQLEFVSHASPDLRIFADPDQLRSVISNLVDNAVAYSKSGGKVTLALAVSRDALTVSVGDRGIGIPQREQNKIFSRFYRASNAVKVRTDGSGLGLYVAREIVQRHGGTMRFESVEGEGTTFYFTLPLKRSSLARERSLGEFVQAI